jgi:uncharacterized protein (TIGR02246 family)
LTLSADDYIAIQQLYGRYAFGLDLHDAEGWLATWTQDGEFHNFGTVTRGHDELRALHERTAARGSKGFHVNTNIVVEPAPYGASGKCYLLFVLAPGESAEVRRALYYTDELVRQDEQWRFRKRTVNAA